MTFEQIIQLSQAGFTAEQIATLAPLLSNNSNSNPTPAVPATPAVPSTPAVPATPAVPTTPAVPAVPAVPATPASTAVVGNEPTMADVLSALNRLTNSITANAVINSNMPSFNPQSAEDALASIVMPTK